MDNTLSKFVLGLVILFSFSACQHIPGGSKIGLELQIGSGKPPTFEEAQAWRLANIPAGKDRVLINGTPVNRKDYPAVINISVGNSGCTAAVIGKRTILTAAHCGSTGQVANFTTITGKKFSAKLQRAPGYPGKDLDLNLGFTSVDIDVPPLPVRLDRFEKKGMKIQLIGYGCTQPGGSGGNDGTLRTGFTKVVAGQGYDLVLEDKAGTGAALCYGDSGGPVLYTGEDGALVVIGVNSKGNIEDTSYTTRLTLEEANAFLAANGISAGGGGNPPPEQQPKVHSFESSEMKVQVECK